MRYSRTELLRRVELTRARVVDDAVRARDAQRRGWDQAFTDWHLDVAPKLRAELVRLVEKLDNGETICYHEVSDLHSLRFRGDHKRPGEVSRAVVRQPEWLEELERVLASMTDDEVSAYALDKAGVLRHVRQLVRTPASRVETSAS